MDDFPMYEDMYEMDEFEMYDSNGEWEEQEATEVPNMTFNELKDNCIIPSLSATIKPISMLLLTCFVLKFTNTLIELPPSVRHLTSIATGLYGLHLFARNKMGYVIILCLLSYSVLLAVHKTLKKQYGAYCGTITILFLVICESVLIDGKDWHVIRGIQMILVMKVISLGFDLDNGTARFPNVLEYFGYCLCVGTVIFGPWVPFNEYMKLLQKTKFTLSWLTNLIVNSAICLSFLLISMCFSYWLIPNNSSKWSLAYRDALSFRSSHYFVSFASEVTTACVGLGTATSLWESSVTKPQHVEAPRSLTEVVIYWNMPMHHWLKI